MMFHPCEHVTAARIDIDLQGVDVAQRVQILFELLRSYFSPPSSGRDFTVKVQLANLIFLFC